MRFTQNYRHYPIYLAYEHSKLLLVNPTYNWRDFTGLQKLQSNLNSEEYFDGLLIFMYAFKDTFPTPQILKDIDRMFKLWNSLNLSHKIYTENLLSFSDFKSASDKHFSIINIVEYLERRYKFNPQYRDELVNWCHKDIELYEEFLKEMHDYNLLTLDEQYECTNNPALKAKKLSYINFEQVKSLKTYFVPRLSSYDILEAIYKHENNLDKLAWLQNIGKCIGYNKG